MNRKDKIHAGPVKEPEEPAGPHAEGRPDQTPTAKSGRKQDYDPFYLRKLYPDPLAIFAHQPPSIRDVKDEAIVVLDTSVLLLPYSSNSGSLNDLKTVYARLAAKDRLIVPAHAAREFARHRFDKLVSLAMQVKQKRDGLQEMQVDASSLLNTLPEITEYRDRVKTINKEIIACRNLLDKAQKTIQEWYCNDPVTQIYRGIITQDVLVDTEAIEQAIIADSDRRDIHEIAPGFKDKGKADGGIGDKIIWKTIVEIGASRKAPLIFVTNDFAKGDNGHFINDKLLFSRYELVEEYRRESEGQSFYMIQLSALMELLAAHKETVEDIRRGEESQRGGKSETIGSFDPQRSYARVFEDLSAKHKHALANLAYYNLFAASPPVASGAHLLRSNRPRGDQKNI